MAHYRFELPMMHSVRKGSIYVAPQIDANNLCVKTGSLVVGGDGGGERRLPLFGFGAAPQQV